jgi:DNA-binding CsgD family transcriptional regulator
MPFNFAMTHMMAEKKNADVSPRMKDESGLILTDESLKPIAFDQGAAAILRHSDSTEDLQSTAGCRIPEEIVKAVRDHKTQEIPDLEIKFRIGTKQYLCRPFLLKLSGPARTFQIALHVEVDRSCPDLVDAFASNYALTARERETLALLSLGLTSKELAERMDVSVNTIKAFLRHLSAKIGVSTRSEIFAKMLQQKDRSRHEQ